MGPKHFTLERELLDIYQSFIDALKSEFLSLIMKAEDYRVYAIPRDFEKRANLIRERFLRLASTLSRLNDARSVQGKLDALVQSIEVATRADVIDMHNNVKKFVLRVRMSVKTSHHSVEEALIDNRRKLFAVGGGYVYPNIKRISALTVNA